ncbi:hypothetical protein P879_08976 [Paragonimus westermani]|uniref:TTI1 N-terminal TPR domain-containing protein n=1 Tax=Paragonimus westermani TaxID=34504 RepID=A0A8T0DKQ3_9TREM|nr:hypothetical protein P879_08976 [Paragonimus westermani]
MAMDPLFHACLQLRHGHWEKGMQKLLSCTQSSTKNDLPMLFNISHPLLRRFICQNVIHKSDSIELFYRVYGNLFELQTAFVEPINAIQVLDDLSSFLFLLSEKVKTVEPPWNCLSDECCLVMFRTVERLLSCLTKDALLIVYSSEQLPLLSHICSTALEMAEFSRSRAVRVQALQTIRHLAQPISRGDCMVAERISAVVAQLLPGVSQSLYRIVTGDSKIGSTVKEAAFDSWTATFLAVFGHTLEPETSCITFNRTDDPDAQLFTDGWYTRTRNRVGKLIQLTVDNLLHVQLELDWEESHRLSTALVRWLTCILTECPVLLQTSVGLTIRDAVVGALIAMAAESESSIPDPVDRPASSRQLAHRALTCFVQSEQVVEVQPTCLPIPQSVTNSRLIRKIATTSLCGQVNSLISLCPNLLDETQLQKRLRTILGYLNFLDAESLSVLVSSRDLFHRLCTSLADLLCFNTSSVELFNDPPQLDFLSSSSFVRARNTMQTVHLFTKSFTAFRDPKSLRLIQAIAGRIAGQENTVDLFLGTCRDVMMLQTGGILRNSCILLITAGLSGYLANGKS